MFKGYDIPEEDKYILGKRFQQGFLYRNREELVIDKGTRLDKNWSKYCIYSNTDIVYYLICKNLVEAGIVKYKSDVQIYNREEVLGNKIIY